MQNLIATEITINRLEGNYTLAETVNGHYKNEVIKRKGCNGI
jgi:hypothetical protein